MKEMTMTPDNDVNAIFEKHSVKEIEDILKKMRSDIERKKEDLRIMVGERYRDLIEAADTISEMRNSAEAVCKNIERMEGLCESLQQRGLIGFKTKMSTSVDNSSRMLGSTHQYSIAVQVKLLVDVPEILWELTEKREYLDAAKLLLLAQQTHTALQLSPNANDILEKFPVISRQWSNISQFRSTITKGCTFLIKNEVENYEQVVNAVAAMTFIEGCDMKTSLKQVLDLRKSSLLSTLTMISILLGQASFSPWSAVVREESKKQAQNIIKKELNLVAESVRQMVQNFIVDIKENAKICMEESDISDFLWSESMSDLPDQNMWLTLNSKNSFEAPEKIVNAVEDFGKVSSSQSEKEDALQDYTLLLEFLEKETLIVFKRFVDDVCKIAMSQFSSLEENLDILCEESVNSVSTPKTTVIVIISRLCQAVPIVCHQLKTCANASLLGSQETARRVGLGLQSDTNTWTELNNFFLEKCTFLMTKYLSITSRIFGKKLRCEINKSVESANPENLLLLFPTWDQVKIEEENEGGRIVESTVSVPGSPSPALLKALMGVCTSVNSVCAHTIPRTSQMQLVSSLCSEIKCSYDGHSDNVNQSTALQLIFDLKLIQNILLPRESKEINSKISSLIQDFESRIDPFDLDVLSPHISSKVKMASQKVLALMGTIIPREKQPLTMKGSSASSNNNMLPIVPSVEIPRFSNVPLPPSASSRKTSIMNTIALEKQLKSSLESSSSASSRDTSTSVTSSKSTASSIFSAMSSSWFGS
ncbi:Conserved oligomeric Golgi complex subunit 1 [Armadillidium nasatum]|uniref:Conserved oligomeric Golgi complex subunit 1 n=1 Tax=Armadillidium nasatum TaxID=96803 RepID=A0A5N5SLK4_9CRUS|nr:Conserved oligomeric Golgi complex subunit 1 [Armadillidium nasatum]